MIVPAAESSMGAARFLTPAVVALSMAFAVASQGQVYTWIDESGEEHFSDNLLAIPPKYRGEFSREFARQTAEKRAAEKRAADEKERQSEDEYRFGHLRPKKEAPDKAAPAAALPAAPPVEPAAPPVNKPAAALTPAAAAVTPESIAAARKHRDLNIPHIKRIIEDLKVGLAEKTDLLKKVDGTGRITIPMDERDIARLRSAIARARGEIQYWEIQLTEMDKPIPEYPDPPAGR